MCHLVDEALHKEHILGVAGRPPWAKRHVRVLEDRDDAQVRQFVGGVAQALCGLWIKTVARILRVRAAREFRMSSAMAVPSAAKPALKRIAACVR